MILNRYYSLIFLLQVLPLFGIQTAECQVSDSTGFIRYTPDYRFNEGIFIHIGQVRQNKPVSVARIVTDIRPDELDFYSSLVQSDKIKYVDDYGISQEIPTSSVWGYCQQGVLFINWNGEFNRIPVIGSLCHFVANQTVIHEQHYDPFYYNYPYQTPAYSTREIRQYMLDFETGKVMDYTEENMEAVLIRDTLLYDEFTELKKRKKRQMKFIFLRRYNESNPLYLPVY